MTLPHPQTDWADMLDEVIECFRNIIEAVAPYASIMLLVPSADYGREKVGDLIERFSKKIILVDIPTNDSWTRDYGPITVESDESVQLLDFTFNGWGLKFAACLDNCANRVLEKKNFWCLPLIGHKEFVLEGGSIDSDGKGHLLTTTECLLSPNRNSWMSKAEIETKLLDIFGLKKILWLDHGYLAGDDTDSHVDTLARFAPNDTIVFVDCQDEADEHFQALQAMKKQIMELTDSEGKPFNLVGLPMPDAIYHPEDGHRLPATYANYLVLADAVIVPSYSQPQKDELARQMLEVVYERKAVSVDCRALIKQHGSLHCSTMQIPIEAFPV